VAIAEKINFGGTIKVTLADTVDHQHWLAGPIESDTVLELHNARPGAQMHLFVQQDEVGAHNLILSVQPDDSVLPLELKPQPGTWSVIQIWVIPDNADSDKVRLVSWRFEADPDK
jgi:hypothetical protein